MNYENLSEELKINIISYLDYETNAFLSYTNKQNHNLYKKIKNNNCISLYSTKKCYIQKKYKDINNPFYTLLFVKIISYNKEYITYKHIKYGKYYNYLYPINSSLTLLNFVIYFLSHDIIYPSYNDIHIISKEDFDKEYEIYKICNKKISFRNKIFFSKFIIHGICIYIFLYIPVICAIYLFYLFYYLFFITIIFLYIFHIILMYEILLTTIVSRNINIENFI